MCGVFGIIGDDISEEASRLVYFALYSLQHRGQESAGIAVVNDQGKIDFHKGMGLVPQVFNENIIKLLKGNVAIGQVRYSTNSSSRIENAQPISINFGVDGHAMLAHNGNLVNVMQLQDELSSDDHEFNFSTDTELIAGMISKYYDGEIISTLKKVLPRLKGAFSLVIMMADKIIAARDPNGIRPLSLGKLKKRNTLVVSSESCALDIIGAELLRPIQKGEIVVLTPYGINSVLYDNTQRDALCVFEYVYFARPDSVIQNRCVYNMRKNMGKELYAEHPVDADLVIAVPDSGVPAAIGFAEASGIPYGEGLIKNRYVGRTFIAPSQILRELGVKIKLNPLRQALQGKRIVVVDDSIVRGTTSAQIVQILRESGATEVHFRVSSPPTIDPCFYGIDTANKEELIAANYSIKQITEKLKVDSLGFLSIASLVKSLDAPNKEFCLGCFNGDYPVPVPEQMSRLGLLFGETENKQ